MLDVRENCVFADYFVICSGNSARQIEALVQEIDQELKKEGIPKGRKEGNADSGWLLLDLGDVIVHIFSQAHREYYGLDELWHQAKMVLKIQ